MQGSRSMLRRLFNVLTLCFAIILVAVFALCIAPTLRFNYHGQQWELSAEGGTFRFTNRASLDLAENRLSQKRIAQSDAFWSLHRRWRNESEAARREKRPIPPEPVEPPPITDSMPRYINFEASAIGTLAGTAFLPALWYAELLWREKKIRNRKAAGCCLKCGFDLRHSPTRCPECGTPVGGAPASSLVD
jgi:hypothetical protein